MAPGQSRGRYDSLVIRFTSKLAPERLDPTPGLIFIADRGIAGVSQGTVWIKNNEVREVANTIAVVVVPNVVKSEISLFNNKVARYVHRPNEPLAQRDSVGNDVHRRPPANSSGGRIKDRDTIGTRGGDQAVELAVTTGLAPCASQKIRPFCYLGI